MDKFAELQQGLVPFHPPLFILDNHPRAPFINGNPLQRSPAFERMLNKRLKVSVLSFSAAWLTGAHHRDRPDRAPRLVVATLSTLRHAGGTR
jgi:hypothetical protein